MKKITLLWLILFTFFTIAHAEFKGLEVSFGVKNTVFMDENKTKYNLYANEPLGFDCTLENEIILQIGDFSYKYDENEKNCVSDDKTGISILTWYSNESNLHAGTFPVDVREVDIVSDDLYLGQQIVLSDKDVVNIQHGEYIEKDIGNNYFIGLKEITIDKNTAIDDFSMTDIATFESFYKESSNVGWVAVGVITVAVAADFAFTGGAFTAAVVSTGTAAGSEIMVAAYAIPGVSAVASMAGAAGTTTVGATSSGLLAIGSVVGGNAATGLLIVGGGLAASSVGGSVILEYGIGKALDNYSYSNFADDSKNMLTLPLPKNTNGSDGYERAMDIIEDIDSVKSISSSDVQETIKQAIKELEPISDDVYKNAKNIVEEMGISDAWNNPDKFNTANDIVNNYEDKRDLEDKEKVRTDTLLSLLYFITNNYKKAKEYAGLSLTLAKKENIKHTAASYLFATSSLYDENLDYETIISHFKDSLLNEPDNPIIPLMLSIHLDRLMYRFDDNIGEVGLSKIFEMITYKSLELYRFQNYIIILSQYFIRLKIEQQKISSLATVDNKTIKDSPKTLAAIKKSFKSYAKLISGANKILNAFEDVEIEDEKVIEVEEKIKTHKDLVSQYDNDKGRLQGLIYDLEEYQESLKMLK